MDCLSCFPYFFYPHWKCRCIPIWKIGVPLFYTRVLFCSLWSTSRPISLPSHWKGKEKAINKDSLSIRSDTHAGGEEDWNEEDEDGSLSPTSTPSKKWKKGNLKRKGAAKRIILQESDSPSTGNDTEVGSSESHSKGDMEATSHVSTTVVQKEVVLSDNVDGKGPMEMPCRYSKWIAKLKN